ncbi:MAG: ABC transporter permease, partial [Bryobacteraceae bacterium]
MAARSLRSNILRSALTLLGIILSTATLIAVMSVIHGMDVYIAQQVSDMGTDGFRVRRVAMMGQVDPKKLLDLQRRSPLLCREEFYFIKEHAQLIREVGMEAWRGVALRYGNEHVRDVQLTGVTANMAVISNMQTAQGRFLSDSEDSKRVGVVFIGNDIKEKFFANVDPVGKTLQIDGRPFQVVGVARKQGSVFG